MDNLSTVLKRKRDAEDRLRRSDPLKNIVIGEDGAGGNTSSNPDDALTVAVESLNTLTGDVVIAAGTNITLTPVGNTITIDATGGGGAFTDLSDVPAAYTGEGGKIVAVKADASGLVFVAAPAATNGVPVGGTAGQVLSKIDGTDYNAEWVDGAVGATPSLRASASYYGSGTTIDLVVPAASEVGDFLVAFIGSDYAVSSVTAGWAIAAQSAAGYHNFAVLLKVCAAGDAGSTITVTMAGNSSRNGFMAVVKDCARVSGMSGSQATTGTVRPTGLAIYSGPNDYGLVFGSARVGNALLTSSIGTVIIARNADAALSSALWELTLTSPVGATVTSPSAASGMGAAIITFKG